MIYLCFNGWGACGSDHTIHRSLIQLSNWLPFCELLKSAFIMVLKSFD